MSTVAGRFEQSAFGRRFGFAESGTSPGRDTIAGITTFIVMSYIIFVNPAILGFSGVETLQGQGLPFEGVLTSTCLVAGVMTIIMGLYTNKAYAIAPGLGLNAVVAFTLVANEGLSSRRRWGSCRRGARGHDPRPCRPARGDHARDPARAEEGDRDRDRTLHRLHRPLQLRLVTGQAGRPGQATPVNLAEFTTYPVLITLFGLVLTIGLRAIGFPGDLLVGIILTTVFATILNYAFDVYPENVGYASWPEDIFQSPDFSLVGEFSFGAFTTLPQQEFSWI